MATIAQSEALFARAQRLVPGGVHSPVRAFKHVGGTPLFFTRGQGAHVWDADGNAYLDFCGSWGPLILGHAHPAAVEAVQEAAANGLSFGTPTPMDVALAEWIVGAFPAMEQVRFVSSGTEAVMTAIRLARGATGRDAILKFAGCYHGHSDSLLVRAGSGVVTQGLPGSAGVPAAVTAQTMVAPLNDLEALESLFASHGERLACAIIEPLPANNGLIPLSDTFLAALIALCQRHGALVIFDEVISGFRLEYGGIANRYAGVDLVTLGKIIGGGMPVGAVLGSRHLMEHLAPVGPVYQAGTLSGNPVAMAAGVATLKALSDGSVYWHLNALADQLQTGIDAGIAAGWQLTWQQVGSIFWGYGRADAAITHADAIEAAAMADYARLHRHLLDAGIYFAPSGYEVGFLSAAHTAADIARLLESLKHFYEAA